MKCKVVYYCSFWHLWTGNIKEAIDQVNLAHILIDTTWITPPFSLKLFISGPISEGIVIEADIPVEQLLTCNDERIRRYAVERINNEVLHI